MGLYESPREVDPSMVPGHVRPGRFRECYLPQKGLFRGRAWEPGFVTCMYRDSRELWLSGKWMRLGYPVADINREHHTGPSELQAVTLLTDRGLFW